MQNSRHTLSTKRKLRIADTRSLQPLRWPWERYLDAFHKHRRFEAAGDALVHDRAVSVPFDMSGQSLNVAPARLTRLRARTQTAKAVEVRKGILGSGRIKEVDESVATAHQVLETHGHVHHIVRSWVALWLPRLHSPLSATTATYRHACNPSRDYG